MKIELFKREENETEGGLLLDSFQVTGVKSMIEQEVSSIKREKEKAKKKAAKDKAKKANETKGNDTETAAETPAEEPEEDEPPIPTPKLKVSIEFSRSRYLQVTKAQVGSFPLDIVQDRKPTQLTTEDLKEARARLRWYKQRDDDK